MFRNYFLTACRNCWRNKAATTIHILGLAVGISAALVIFLIVQYEYSFDRFEKDRDRIYRVVMNIQSADKTGHSAAIPAPLPDAVQHELSGIEQTIPVFQYPGSTTAKIAVKQQAQVPELFKNQPDIIFTSQAYFSLLSYRWLAGSPVSALQQPFTAVLTAAKAQQYFPRQAFSDIIGKQMTFDDNLTVTVTGIVDNLNQHTSFTAQTFLSFPTIAASELKDRFMLHTWNDWMSYSQLLLKLLPGNTPANTEAQLKQLFAKYNKNTANKGPALSFHLQPLNDIHFNSAYQGNNQRIAHKPTLYGLLAIAAFLLLLGCINFINLTTAQAAQRAKEIGIRKTMGSSRKNLVLQFLGETFFITAIASGLSVLLAPLLLRAFAGFIPKGLDTTSLFSAYLLLFLLGLTVLVSLLAGLYPAFILAGYKPVQVLKKHIHHSTGQSRSTLARKSLTVTQFVIAQFFIMATVVVGKQIHYSLHKDLGYRKDAILNFDTPVRDTVVAHNRQLAAAISTIRGVELVSTGFLTPADIGAAYTDISYFNGKTTLKPEVQIRWGDSNYLKVYAIQLLAGRNVQSSDTVKEFLINATYARALGFRQPADALNHYLQWNNKQVLVVGVIQDFHDQSLRSAITPLAFTSRSGGTFHIKLSDNAGIAEWPHIIQQIRNAYTTVYPDGDFSYSFFDDTIGGFYTAEQNTAQLLQWATGLTVFISCLGLLGLVTYTTGMRTKEIGIRKILGATPAHIASLLSADFIKLVCIAFAIAIPLAWWASFSWLQNFVYRTTISWWVFAFSGLAMLLFALLTLSLQTIKAAYANPVKNLRGE